MKPTTVRELLLGLGFAAGLSGPINGCSSESSPTTTPSGASGTVERGVGGLPGGVGNAISTGGARGVNGPDGMGGRPLIGGSGNVLRGGNTGHVDPAADAGDDASGDGQPVATTPDASDPDAQPDGI
jgi:hypothetical protein